MLRSLLRVVLAGLFAGSAATSPCLGQSLIPVGNRLDHVFGPGGRVLYLTTDEGCIVRYDLVRHRLLPNWGAGRQLLGIDISPARLKCALLSLDTLQHALADAVEGERVEAQA